MSSRSDRGGECDETIVVRPAPASSSRPADGVTSRHAFSAGDHYDPANTHHGLVLAHDDHRLAAGCGFPRHAHRDVDVVSVVLAGTLHHRDDRGGDALVPAGAVSVWGSGVGALHSEHATSAGPARVLQIHLAGGADHLHRSVRVDACPRAQGWGVVAGDGGALALSVPSGQVLVCALQRGADLTVPGASWCHFTVVTGAVDLPGTVVPRTARAGTTVRATRADPWMVHAQEDSTLVAVVGRVDLRRWVESSLTQS